MKSPRIILWDVENSHNLAAVFQLRHNDYINPDNIVQEKFLISAAWKELGASTTHAVSILDDPSRFKKNPYDDRHVVTTLHKVLSGADVLIAHNGDEFDLKLTKGRILIHGLDPLPPIPTIDTLKTARSQFLLNANNLNYLAKVLGVGKKIHTDNELWLRILKGDKAAIREMVVYNKHDVELLERVFLKLQPYIANHVNRHLFGGKGCPRCGSGKVQSRGVHRAISQVYQRFQCQGCGGWFRELKADRTKSAKTRVL